MSPITDSFKAVVPEHSNDGNRHTDAVSDDPIRDLRRTLDPARAIALLSALGLTDLDIATAVGATDRTVRRWRAGGEESGPARRWREVDDLRAIVVVLLEDGLLDGPGAIHWLRARNRRLRDQRPIDVLQGDGFDSVRDAALEFIHD